MMKLSVEQKLIVDKEKDEKLIDDYFEVGKDEDITIYAKDGSIFSATVLEINDDNIVVTDYDDDKTVTVDFSMIENIELG